MSRRSFWFAVLRGRQERDVAATGGPMAAPMAASQAFSVPALLRGRWRVDDDDDRQGDTYFMAAHAQRGPYFEVTE